MTNAEPTIVGGRYELGELLGRGGMAEVRKGTDTRLGRVVAVKRLRTDLASDATFQARFRREAQSSASLNHPAIVAVYDTGEEVTPDGVHQPYIVMEYVAGRTLRDILREGRKILPERALEITSGVLSALDYSHRAGIIHRDIKPGNVMLTPSGDVKVMDFGIARAISDAQSTMTQTAAVVGTAQYLSPEQARGETVDSRSDVYSAGCLLYELLTGRPPFVGDSPVAVAYQHVREQPQPPSDHDTELPPEVDAIVMKSLAKRVEDRYQSAAAMRSDIERYLDGRPISVVAAAAPVGSAQGGPPTSTVVAAPLTAAGTGPGALEEEAEDEHRSRTGLLIFLGVLVIALITAAVLLWPKLFPSSPDQIQVPRLVNLTEAQARSAIGDAGLTVTNVEFDNSDTVAAGSVIRQQPQPDTYVDPGSGVEITLSAGKPQVAVPNVVGMQLKDAKAALEQAGLTAKTQERESDEPKNKVLESNPTPGLKVDAGQPVTLYYSDGPEQVPDVRGKTQAQAEQILRDAGFDPEARPEPNTTQPKGTVVDQFPQAPETRKQGEKVLIFVSTYEPPPPVTTPSTPCITPTPGIPPLPGEPSACPTNGQQ
ncbi:Stk1 family PASTA domain-containing Ser/Thr kinase [Nocardioides sp. CER19]|uniref:Stk1 family PASTA domain-containing Ser/Thr kinase n=1 Tax=Nocardioides sp. CER19 TaxID=3038538 RepID=UPI00244B37BE|nr:Stk1 family PASTA domain-containing Ser/Thr kinase [Nocardioides sp. CER19]MDH2412778.1 Stk1 family PASTA domain-containing Ser/Thr kinase [Nocardioides sp. CER19]